MLRLPQNLLDWVRVLVHPGETLFRESAPAMMWVRSPFSVSILIEQVV